MKKAIIGNGGHAMEVFHQMKTDVVFFVDDQYVTDKTLPISKFNHQEYEVIIAIGDPNTREKICKKLTKETKYFTFIHPTALIMDNTIEIGEGSFIGAYSILTTNIKIGKHTILNRFCQIGHETQCGQYLTMMPGSVISGNCTIGDRVYFGTNSSVREKIKICDDVTIGLNGGVVKNINEPGTYVGLPVKKAK
jgi:sugar O-acyltransferase (sialic acid O-acetyltransferase NeuD family)